MIYNSLTAIFRCVMKYVIGQAFNRLPVEIKNKKWDYTTIT